MLTTAVKTFYQSVYLGDFVSEDGWKIKPDPLVEGGNNFCQIWRLFSPNGLEQAVGYSPLNIEFHQFEIQSISYIRLKRSDLSQHYR